MNLSQIFRNFQNGHHFESKRTFKPVVVPKVESCSTIGHTIPYILRFWSTLYLKNWRSCGNFKIWPTFWPRDLVIWPLTYKNYRLLRASRLHMGMKFGDDRSKTATCIASQTDKQTNKQTNRQTVKRTYLQISSKFWQVIKRRQKWIKRVKNSPIPLIRGRRLRIWSQIKATLNSLNFHKMAAIFMQK